VENLKALTTGAHSKIGASSMYRWSSCPGSVKLAAQFPSISSVYALEGTKAHELAATLLQGVGGTIQDVSEEMYDAVQVYIEEVNRAVAACKDWKKGDLLIEHRFDLSQIHQGLFGTADCVIFDRSAKTLRVYDYKHGAGIAVDVENNDQLKYYALGALITTDYKPETVELVIVQPRCPHEGGIVRKWAFPTIDLIDFSSDLKAFAVATEDPNAVLKAGEHCQFCPAAPMCPELNKQALEAAKNEFKPEFSYSPEKLAEILTWIPTFTQWIKNLNEFAYREAQHGRIPPGFKLVAKRANRKWMDEGDAELQLNALGYGNDKILEIPALKSPAQIEKIIGGKTAKEIISQLVVQESSGLTLAPESDRRQAVTPAIEDFTAIDAVENLLE